ncbi:Endoplasmic Reticulum [Bonamia ostreae]|uniref:Endoplasmic Reticulum n=1 Tax=Bonamia ostreae TaxID=126728 RepID=A0ABV2AL40_9EUKA
MTIIILLILLVGLHNSCKDFKVPQCDCYGTDVLEVNRHVHGILSELKKTLFFRIFKVALDEKCLFWNAQKFCVKPSCAVCPCEDGDVPQKWRDEADFLRVNRKTSIGFLPWTEDDEMWIVSPNDEKSVYIDLAANPHEDTGYGGESAHKVWKAIYGENCLHGSF